MKSIVDSLTAKANASSKTVTKEYSNTITKLSTATTTENFTIEEKTKEVATASTAAITKINDVYHLPPAPTSTLLGALSPSYLPSRPSQKADYPDEYFINGQKRQIKVYKFDKDNTPINYELSTGVLEIYTYLATIATQYGICITPLDNVQKWTDPTMDKPPTFPFIP